MAFLQLTSTNPDLSYIIKKNPASGMLVKQMRMGRAFGWFSSDYMYNVFFKDADNEVSYKSSPDESFEYVNTSRYSSPMFVINAITDFFNSAVKKQEEKDVAGFTHTITMNMVMMRSPRYLGIFNQHFTEFFIDHEEVAPKTFRIQVTTRRPLRDLLNYVNLLALFSVLRRSRKYDNTDFDVSEPVIEKYLACLAVVNAPYFVRYVFKVNLLGTSSMFKKFKDVLSTDGIELVIGDTQIQRLNAVVSRLTMLNHVVDIGCGEGMYAIAIARKLCDKQYFAIDTSEDCREQVMNKAKLKSVDNITVLDSFNQFLDMTTGWDQDFDALMVEVIEHMEVAEASALVKQVLAFPNVKSLLISTPNRDFNQFYFADDELRHTDHKFEFTADEFTSWVKSVTPDNFTVKQFDIGDRVNGHATTLGAWFCKSST